MSICRWVLAPLLLVLSGCPTPSKPKGYFGPTDPMVKVVNDINANSARVPTLWATMHFWEADLYDEAHKHTYVNGDGGSLMFRKPGDLYLTATRPGMEVLNLGSNGDTFWVQAAKDT